MVFARKSRAMEKYESSDHAAKLNDTHLSFEFPETTGQRPEPDRDRQHKSRRGHSVHHCRFEVRVRGDLEEERCIPQHQRTRCKESREREKQSRRCCHIALTFHGQVPFSLIAPERVNSKRFLAITAEQRGKYPVLVRVLPDSDYGLQRLFSPIIDRRSRSMHAPG